MLNAYRVHFQPAAQQLIPGADPYILSLVQAVCRPAPSRASTEHRSEHPAERHLERHCEALGVSFDRNMHACVVSPAPALDCRQNRVDRRSIPQPVATARRQREAWAGA